MRKSFLLLLFSVVASPVFATTHVGVEQLERVLATAHGRSDAEVAQELSGLELTERLSTVRLAHWDAELPGSKAQQALIVLADSSAFLDLPATEIPATTAPDFVAQRRIMALVVDYVRDMIHQLPNFLAVRNTTHFEDRPQEDVQTDTAMVSYSFQPLHFMKKSSVTVTYRDGKEVTDAAALKARKREPEPPGLISHGEFGPILSTVLVDAAKGNLAWSHWEQGASGPEAVFRYTVLKEKAHYAVQFCCISEGIGNLSNIYPFNKPVGYHGEIAVDATSGEILRMTVEANLELGDPLSKAAIMVEYGPVEIGGKSYICLLKSISVSKAPAPQRWRGQYATGNTHRPQMTFHNDVVYGQYHQFRATTRILTGDDGNVEANRPSSELADAKPTDSTNEEPAHAEVAIAAPLTQDIAGDYFGTVEGTHIVRLHLRLTSDGALTGTFDQPEAMEGGYSLEDIHLDGQTLSFGVTRHYDGEWKGTVSSDGNALTGNLVQWAGTTPMNFVRFVPAAKPSLVDGIWLTKLGGTGATQRVQLVVKSDAAGNEFCTLACPISASCTSRMERG